MRAVICDRFNGIEALRLGDIPEPQPGPDEILIDVHCACVSFVDYLMSKGDYQVRPTLPYVPGTDAAGIVVACGEEVTDFSPGDRVACGNWYGGFGERMIAKATGSVRLPESIDFAVGSTILQTYTTAWYALVEQAKLRPGEIVLITGAAGGVGLACIEIARLHGARLIAAVGSAAKAAVVRDQGADEVIDLASEYLRGRVNALTDNQGIDVCVDNVGGSLFGALATVMRWNGRLLPLGFASGEIPALEMNIPLMKNYAIVGANTGAWGERFPAERKRAIDRIMALVGEGELHPRVDRVLPLDRVADAMSAIEDRSVQGRVVLQVR